MNYRIRIETGDGTSYYFPQVKINFIRWDNLVPHLTNDGYVFVSKNAAQGYGNKEAALKVIQNHKTQQNKQVPNVTYELVH